MVAKRAQKQPPRLGSNVSRATPNWRADARRVLDGGRHPRTRRDRRMADYARPLDRMVRDPANATAGSDYFLTGEKP